MRKTATITINDRVITVNELTVKQMLSLQGSFALGNMLSATRTILPLLTDASEEFLLELAPSELKELYEKVKEVNADFFDWTGLESILAGVKEVLTLTVQKNLAELSAGSLPAATDKPSGSTESASSSQPLKPSTGRK